MCACLDGQRFGIVIFNLVQKLLRPRSKLTQTEQEVTASAWFALRSDKHLMLHSHDEASFVLSAVGCAHYSSHFISGHSLSL